MRLWFVKQMILTFGQMTDDVDDAYVNNAYFQS